MVLLWSIEQLDALLQSFLSVSDTSNLIHKIGFDADNNIVIPHHNDNIVIDQLTLEIKSVPVDSNNPLLHEVRYL